MERALRLAATILTQFVEVRGESHRSPNAVAGIICVLVAAVAILAAAGLLISSLWFAIPVEWGPTAAPLVCTAILVLASAVLILVAIILRRHRPADSFNPLGKLIQQVDSAKLLHDHLVDLLVVAAVLGLLTGSNARPRGDGVPR
jgi:hypothetical protein